jgi:hypothetical protein
MDLCVLLLVHVQVLSTQDGEKFEPAYRAYRQRDIVTLGRDFEV